MIYKRKQIQTNENTIMLADSYKYSHPKQYPSNTVSMYDYAEARSGKEYAKTVFEGLQPIMMKYLSKKITKKMVKEAKMYANAHGISFEAKGWMYIAKTLKGKLPIRIKAIPEGTVVPTGNPLFTVESTDKEVFWVASWAETILMKVWYMSNIATRSYYVRQLLKEYADITQDNPFIDYQYHNFGDRGSSSVESAGMGGVAHLTQFMGTDNFNSMTYAMKYYGVEDINTIGHSIAATEHSSTTSWGKEQEFEMIMNHLDQNQGAPIIAAVMDSYDYFKAVGVVCNQEGEFQTKINTDEYGMFVMRPDSGKPEEIIPKTLDIMEESNVPFITNDKGYKVFNKMRIIWGDGINMDSMKVMLEIIESRGYSSEIIAFGSGGWLMQQHDRDTQGWAVKCSSITVAGGIPRMQTNIDVFKDPITAPGKVSKKGKVTTFRNDFTGEYMVGIVGTKIPDYTDQLETVFENGKMVKIYTLDEVRANSRKE